MDEYNYSQFLEDIDPDVNHYADYKINFNSFDLRVLKEQH